MMKTADNMLDAAGTTILKEAIPYAIERGIHALENKVNGENKEFKERNNEYSGDLRKDMKQIFLNQRNIDAVCDTLSIVSKPAKMIIKGYKHAKNVANYVCVNEDDENKEIIKQIKKERDEFTNEEKQQSFALAM